MFNPRNLRFDPSHVVAVLSPSTSSSFWPTKVAPSLILLCAHCANHWPRYTNSWSVLSKESSTWITSWMARNWGYKVLTILTTIGNHGLIGYLSVHPANQPSIKQQFCIPYSLLAWQWLKLSSQFNSTGVSLLGKWRDFESRITGFLVILLGEDGGDGYPDTHSKKPWTHSHSPRFRSCWAGLSAESSRWSQLSAFGEMLHTQGRPLSLATWPGSQSCWATKAAQVVFRSKSYIGPGFCLSVCLTVAWGRWCNVIFSSRTLRGRLLIIFASRTLWRSFNFKRISHLCNMHTWTFKYVMGSIIPCNTYTYCTLPNGSKTCEAFTLQCPPKLLIFKPSLIFSSSDLHFRKPFGCW